VCDDSLGFPALVRAWLGADGRLAHVGHAATGAEVRALVADVRADVVLLDLVLPDVEDPAPLVADLREARPGVRVILVSSMPEEHLEGAAARAGVDGFANKATTADAFCDLVYAAGRVNQNRLP